MRSAEVLVLALALLLAPALPARAADKSKSDNLDSSNTKVDASDETAHHGGIKDLNAIGHRNVGCGRGVGNWYSLDKQIAMGKGFAEQITRTARLVQDPVVNEYVNRIGQNLVHNSDAEVPFTIKVIDSDEVNAFALPGGFFFVNSGLILAAGNESEMAGVMAHEIGHVAACHAARGATRGQLASLASLPLIFVGGGVGYAVSGVAGLTVPASFLKFSRDFERQADYLGIEYLYKTGYDPQTYVQFFEKIEAMEKKKPGFMDKTFGTHPLTPDRIEAAQKEIAQILPPKSQYLLDTSEFEDVKARLEKLQNRRHMQEGKQSSPALRRDDTPDTNRTEHPNDKQDDDHPTLHRAER
ncbi:MAG: M48 family metallopeptidase [Candidatus Korobacteraceae bacterium]